MPEYQGLQCFSFNVRGSASDTFGTLLRTAIGNRSIDHIR